MSYKVQGKNSSLEVNSVVRDTIKYLRGMGTLNFAGWILTIYVMSAFLVINPILLIMNQMSLFDLFKIYSDPTLGLISHLGSLGMLGATGLSGLYLHVRQREDALPVRPPLTRPVEKVEVVAPKPVVIPEPVEPEPVECNLPLDITTNAEGKFLRYGAESQDIIIDDVQSKLYNWKDLRFQFETNPHWLIVGSSGAGKTVSTYNLLRALNEQLSYPQVIIADAGGADYQDALARKNDEIMGAIDHIYWIAMGRMEELKKDKTTKFSPIIFLLEEAEVFLAEVALLPKKESEAFLTKLARLMLTCRKININFVFVLQTGSASVMGTNLTNNIANHLYLRMGQRATSYIYKLPYKMKNLGPGIAYYPTIDGFVKFSHIQSAPKMNVMSWEELETQSLTAQRRYRLGPNNQEVEIE